MKKRYLIIMLLFIIIGLSVFIFWPKSKEKDVYLEKPITGIDPVFKESLGYYNEFPSIIRTSNTVQYLYYTRNAIKFNDTKDEIVVRKGKLENGKWIYSEPKVTLSLSNEGWDSKYIFSPSVVKGEFILSGEIYHYLMAYSGSITERRLNAQIGFAVSKTLDGEFIRVGNEPIITFNKNIYTSSGLKDFKGAQEPSLISYDKKGKIQLFYSFYETYNHSYAVEMDCSNLHNIIKGGRMLSEVSGLSDATINTHLYSASWSYNPVHEEYVVVRNFSSPTTGQPSVAEAIQVVRASTKVISEVDNSRDETGGKISYWQLANDSYYKIGAVKTANDYSLDSTKWSGYYRVYNAGLITDPYGWVLFTDKVELIFTSSALEDNHLLKDDQYLYSPMLHFYEIDIIRE